MKKQMTFDEWKEKVAQLVELLCEMHPDDLPDWDYWNSWDNGDTPREAARQAVENAMRF